MSVLALNQFGNPCPICKIMLYNNDETEHHYWFHKLERLEAEGEKK